MRTGSKISRLAKIVHISEANINLHVFEESLPHEESCMYKTNISMFPNKKRIMKRHENVSTW